MNVIPEERRFRNARNRMVDELVAGRGVSDPAVHRAMREVPRHLFAGESLRFQAYGDHALPIGWGQTISQPYIVALMTEALRLSGGEKVLEVGTGSGYQAAVLARLAARVYTMERIPELAGSARLAIDQSGARNVVLRAGDATDGWKEHAPFDRILVTAGADKFPDKLAVQLADPGIMVCPVGPDQNQNLLVLERDGADTLIDLGACRFVPFVSGRPAAGNRRT